MNNNKPFFSVVIPTYNCIELLKEAVGSVLAQTNQNFEILIIDNRSVDGTKKYIESISDSRVICYEVDNDGVIGLSRNIGIQNSKGKWIAFLDADDIWYNDKLAKVKSVIDDNSDIILVSHDEYFVRSNGEKTLRKSIPKTENVEESLLRYGSCLMTSAVVVRCDIAIMSGGFSEKKEFVTAEDYEFWINLSRLGKFYFLGDVLGEWREHDANTSANNIVVHANSSIAVGLYHLGIWKNNHSKRTWVAKEIESRIYSTASHALISGGIFSKAREFAVASIILSPYRWKAWAVFLLSIAKVKIK